MSTPMDKTKPIGYTAHFKKLGEKSSEHVPLVDLHLHPVWLSILPLPTQQEMILKATITRKHMSNYTVWPTAPLFEDM
jgi:hypothetical protein